MELSGKTIAITGAARGLGQAMAERLARAGAHLALLDRTAESLEDTRSRVAAHGGHVQIYGGDVASEADVDAAFDAIVRDFGAVHGLVNNAGITRDALTVKKQRDGTMTSMSLAQWQSVIDVNLTGVFLCGRAAAARMVEHDWSGCVINISSISRGGNLGQINYSAAKAGVEAMAVVWAKEWARYGIRAASIAPGFIATEMVAAMKPEALAKLSAMIPAQRMGEPDEIARCVQFIFENDYFNGRCLELDGGLRL